MTSVNLEPLLSKTSTKYNIHFMAEHPLKMGMAPSHKVFLDELEAIAARHGMTPVSAVVGRSDDQWGENESGAWLQNLSDDLLLAFGKLIDGFVSQALDPESDVDIEQFDEADFNSSVVETVERFIQHRESLKEQKQ